MKIHLKKYAQALYEALSGAESHKSEKIISRYVLLLARHGILSKYRVIISEFEKYFNKREGILEVSVTSSMKLTAAEISHITKNFEKITGKKIAIKEYIKPEVLGGIVIQYEDKILDGSVFGQIQNLKKHLTHCYE